MNRFVLITAAACMLTLTFGCSKEEAPQAQTPAPPAPVAKAEQVMDKAHEAMKETHEGMKMAAEEATASLDTGKAVYQKTCSVCHATGLAGAPKIGDKAAWSVHTAEGIEHLMHVAIHGEGGMPPKGGNPALSDEEVRAAVNYMLEQSR